MSRRLAVFLVLVSLGAVFLFLGARAGLADCPAATFTMKPKLMAEGCTVDTSSPIDPIYHYYWAETPILVPDRIHYRLYYKLDVPQCTCTDDQGNTYTIEGSAGPRFYGGSGKELAVGGWSYGADENGSWLEFRDPYWWNWSGVPAAPLSNWLYDGLTDQQKKEYDLWATGLSPMPYITTYSISCVVETMDCEGKPHVTDKWSAKFPLVCIPGWLQRCVQSTGLGEDGGVVMKLGNPWAPGIDTSVNIPVPIKGIRGDWGVDMNFPAAKGEVRLWGTEGGDYNGYIDMDFEPMAGTVDLSDSFSAKIGGNLDLQVTAKPFLLKVDGGVKGEVTYTAPEVPLYWGVYMGLEATGKVGLRGTLVGAGERYDSGRYTPVAVALGLNAFNIDVPAIWVQPGFELFVYLKTGVDSVATAKGGIDFAAQMEAQAPGIVNNPCGPPWLYSWEASVRPKIKVQVFDWSFDWGENFKYERKCSANSANNGSSSSSGTQALRSRFVGSRAESVVRRPGETRLAGVPENALEPILNVGLDPRPALAVNGNNAIVAYTMEDSAKPLGLCNEIYAAKWTPTADGGFWEQPTRITNDLVPDIQPAVAYNSANQPVVVWTRSVTANSNDLGKQAVPLMQKMDIVYSVFNGTNWTGPYQMMSPADPADSPIMDCLPTISRGSDGTLKAYWIRTPNNNFPIGPEEGGVWRNGMEIWEAVWNPGSTGFGTPNRVISYDYDPNTYEILYPDTGNSFDLATGSKISAIHCAGGDMLLWNQYKGGYFWSSYDCGVYWAFRPNGQARFSLPQQLTVDAMNELSPSVTLNADGQPMAIWTNRESDTLSRIYTSVFDGTGWSAPIKVCDTQGIGKPIIFNDPALQRPVAIWDQLASKGSDVYSSIFDPVASTWSTPHALTSGPEEERAISAAVGTGSIVAAFERSHAPDASGNPDFEGDIYVLKSALDLEIGSGDLICTPALPVRGQSVALTAQVRCTGTSNADNVAVSFYDGDPANGGTLLGSAVAAGQPGNRIAPNGTGTASLTCTLPAGASAVSLYAVVDPSNAFKEVDETNNIACKRFGEDLIAGTLTLAGYNVGDPALHITTAVTNAGASDVGPVQTLICTSPSDIKTMIYNYTFGKIAAGETRGLDSSSTSTGIDWDLAGVRAGHKKLYLTVDPNNRLTDSDRANNVSSAEIDLPTDISVSGGDVRWGIGKLEAIATVTNSSPLSTGDFLVHVVSNGVVVGSTTISLVGRECKVVNISCPVAGTPPTMLQIFANPLKADGTRDVMESNLANNSVIINIPADLRRIVAVSASGDDANNGSTWVLAMRSIQAAIDYAATNHCEVWVAKGQYDKITLHGGVPVYGGFTGAETMRSERIQNPQAEELKDWLGNTPSIYNSVIDAKSNGCAVTIQANTGNVTRLDGFRIINGTTGGILCDSSPVTICNNTIANNSGDAFGGIYTPMGSSALITNNSILNNTATVFSGDSTTGLGGGIHCAGGSTPTISRNLIKGNRANFFQDVCSWYAMGGSGGGIYCLDSGAQILGNWIIQNSGVYGGGIYAGGYGLGACQLIANNFISQNEADAGYDCSGGSGGGVYCLSNITLINNTITRNRASVSGGGIETYYSCNYTLTNNIVTGNSTGIHGYGLLQGGTNCVYGNNGLDYVGCQAADGDINLDPMVDSWSGYRLSADSPCIGAGNTLAVSPAWLDIDGNFRIIPLRGRVDIGASEFVGTPTAYAPIFSPDGKKPLAEGVVTITTPTAGALIYYTTDGCTPTTGSAFVPSGGTVTFDQPTYLRAMTVNGGFAPSSVTSAYFTLQPVIHVSPQGNNGNTGLTWSSALPSIQDAIDAANLGDIKEIWVAKGVYQGNYTLHDGVQLYGGFAGTEAARSQRVPRQTDGMDPNESVLDANQSGAVVTIPVSVPESAPSVLDGFTIKGGDTYGGIRCIGGNTTISNNLIRWNASTSNGGGIHVSAGSPTITRNTIQYNNALANTATGAGGLGGGIFVAPSSTPIISYNLVDSNRAYYHWNPTTQIYSAGAGGGIYCRQSGAVLQGNTIVGNCAMDGGGIAAGGNTEPITSNVIARNMAEDGYMGSTYAPGIGGGVSVNGDASLINNTLMQNWGGWQVSLTGEVGSTATLTNNIVAYGTGGISRLGGIDVTLSHNCVYWNYGDYYSGLAQGPTDMTWMNPWLSFDDYHLFTGSPCIDAGEFINYYSSDIDGQSRCQGGGVDIGADEYTPFVP